MADLKKHPQQSSSFSDYVAEGQGQDYFDLLPDPILLLIFNKVLDAKSLSRCLLVSKRFASLVPLIDSVSLQITNYAPPKSSSKDSKGNFFRGFVSKFVTKPFQFFNQIIGKKPSSYSSSKDSGFDVLHWVGTALKNFNEIQSLKLELPCYGGETGVNRAIPLLKWEAGFGKELERCVILGASSIVQSKEKIEGSRDQGSDQNSEEEQLFSDEELKLRIIWIISCLIASSARHNLLKKVVNSCPKLSSAVISDAGKQGKLSMDAGQIKELRESMKTNPSESELESATRPEPTSEPTAAVVAAGQMGYVGNLLMKLWYVKELELPSSGEVMKGATMVVIRPDGKGERESGGGNGGSSGGDGLNGGVMKRAFEGDEIFGEAARELLRRKEKRVYRLEMNTF